MLRLSILRVALGLFTVALAVVAAEGDRVPVLLELFTSEGCSSCPPADRLLQDLDQSQPVPHANLIVLGEHVDYWDRLGWKDRFSSSQYTTRQQTYDSKYNLDTVYTPQLVVDGKFSMVGSDAQGARSAIEKAIRDQKVAIAFSKIVRDGSDLGLHVDVAAAANDAKGQAVLYLAIAEDRAESKVAAGENAGRSLTHVAVARIIKSFGAINLSAPSSKDLYLSLPSAGAKGLRLVAFLQDPKTGHVLGAAAQKL